MRFYLFIFVLLVAVLSPADLRVEKPAAPSAAETGVGPASAEDIKQIKNLDAKFQTAKSINIDVNKTLVLSLLKQERNSSGRLLISNGRLRLEIDPPDKSLLVVNKKNVWIVTYPPPEFKGAVVQVIQSTIDSKKARSQSFLSLLTTGRFLKYFSVSGVEKRANGEKVFFLQPQEQMVEFKRAQALVSADGKVLLELRYWDEIDNETRYTFKKTVFDKPLSDKLFQFVPPKGADVTQM